MHGAETEVLKMPNYQPKMDKYVCSEFLDCFGQGCVAVGPHRVSELEPPGAVTLARLRLHLKYGTGICLIIHANYMELDLIGSVFHCISGYVGDR